MWTVRFTDGIRPGGRRRYLAARLETITADGLEGCDDLLTVGEDLVGEEQAMTAVPWGRT